MSNWQSAHGKIILTGEHAVVYGQPAIAGAFPNAISAKVSPSAGGISIQFPHWGYHSSLPSTDKADMLVDVLQLILARLGLARHSFALELNARVRPGMGLGASASLAVATIRALDYHYTLGLTLAEVNALAFECEILSHGRPSGIDNTMACFGGLCAFQRAQGDNVLKPIVAAAPLNLVVVMTPETGSTAAMVAMVAERVEQDPVGCHAIFEEIGELSRQAGTAVRHGDLVLLGKLMARNHELLAELGVSTAHINGVVAQLCDAGALGAKLTGSGGGGAVIALCDNNSHGLAQAMARRGNDVMEVQLGV